MYEIMRDGETSGGKRSDIGLIMDMLMVITPGTDEVLYLVFIYMYIVFPPFRCSSSFN